MIIAGTVRQFLRFAVVGVVSNAVLYAGYLLLTSLGMGAKSAMSLVYVTGVALTFLINKRWTFSLQAGGSKPFVRYCFSYLGGYVLNLLTLHVFVSVLGFPHQVVQGFALVEVAVILFVLHKFWVFRPSNASPAAREQT